MTWMSHLFIFMQANNVKESLSEGTWRRVLPHLTDGSRGGGGGTGPWPQMKA